MNTLERALQNFSEYLKQISPEEVEKRLDILEKNNYSGITMNELCLNSNDSIVFSFKTEVYNFGWFAVNTPYFKKVSSFFCQEFESVDQIFWNANPPPLPDSLDSPGISDPQNDFVGFLF